MNFRSKCSESFWYYITPVRFMTPTQGLVTSLRNLSASFGPLLFNWLFAFFISAKAPLQIPNIVFYVSAVCGLLATILAITIVLCNKEQELRVLREEKPAETVELTAPESDSEATL